MGDWDETALTANLWEASQPVPEQRFTPRKTNGWIPKIAMFEAGVTFCKPSFWVSMLVFGGVDGWESDLAA